MMYSFLTALTVHSWTGLVLLSPHNAANLQQLFLELWWKSSVMLPVSPSSSWYSQMHFCRIHPCRFSPSRSCAGQFPVPDESWLGGTVQASVCPSASSGPRPPRRRSAVQGQRDRCPAAGVQRAGGTAGHRQGTNHGGTPLHYGHSDIAAQALPLLDNIGTSHYVRLCDAMLLKTASLLGDKMTVQQKAAFNGLFLIVGQMTHLSY